MMFILEWALFFKGIILLFFFYILNLLISLVHPMLSFVKYISIRNVNFGFGHDWLLLVLGKTEPGATFCSALCFPFQFKQWASTSGSEPETVLPQQGHHTVWRRFWLLVPGGSTRAFGVCGGRLGCCWAGWGAQDSIPAKTVPRASSAKNKPL